MTFLLRSPGTRAAILIVVVGICGLLTSLALAFLAYVQQGAASGEAAVRESQSRLMLHAGVAFVLESARMGYGPDPRYGVAGPGNGLIANPSIAGTPWQHREGFGWIDIRDNSVGPKDQVGTPVWTGMPNHVAGSWPEVGGRVLCPMFRWTRTRYAIRPTVAHNAIETDPTRPTYGYPFLNVPDPQPVGMQVIRNPASTNGALIESPSLSNPGALGALFTAYAFRPSEVPGGQVDSTPVPTSQDLAWFRVYRCRHPLNPALLAATFIITCGAGGTYGFRDWNEVIAPSPTLVVRGGLTPPYARYFDNNQAVFESLRKAEAIAWYEVRWSASVKVYTNDQMYVGASSNNTGTTYAKDALPSYPFTTAATDGSNVSKPDWGYAGANIFRNAVNQSVASSQGAGLASGFSPNQIGTVSYIQRLDMGADDAGAIGYIQPVRNPAKAQMVYTDW